MQDEVAYQCHGSLGRIHEHGVAASREALEASQVLRQGRGEIRLTLDRRHRVFLSAQHEGGALDPLKDREEVKRVPFTAGLCEPVTDLRMADGPLDRVGIARRPAVERECHAHPGLERGRVSVALEEPAAGQGSNLRPAEPLEERNPALPIRAARSLGVSENQLGGVGRMARRRAAASAGLGRGL